VKKRAKSSPAIARERTVNPLSNALPATYCLPASRDVRGLRQLRYSLTWRHGRCFTAGASRQVLHQGNHSGDATMGKVTVQMKTTEIKKAGDECDPPKFTNYSKGILAALKKAGLSATKVEAEPGGSASIIKLTVESKDGLDANQIKNALR
jgi:hypothetical protein